jgi:hypothetical protein
MSIKTQSPSPSLRAGGEESVKRSGLVTGHVRHGVGDSGHGVRKLAIAASSGDTTPRLLNVLSREGLSARLHIPILPVAAVELVLVAKAIARNSRFLGPPAKVDNAGFLPVDFQPKPHLDLLFDKLLERTSTAKVIAITNRSTSMLTKESDFALCVPADDSPLCGEHGAARVSQLSIVYALFLAVAQRNPAATETDLSRTMFAAPGPREAVVSTASAADDAGIGLAM